MINDIDEAIVHAREVAKELKQKHSDLLEQPKIDRQAVSDCWECAREHEQLAEILTELKKRREADRWIPVTERLPENFNNYLVVLAFGDKLDIDIGTYHPRNASKFWSLCDADGFYWAEDRNVEVVAWRPLPEYKESEEVRNER